MIPSNGPTGSFWITARPPQKVLIGWSAASPGPSVAKYSKISVQNSASPRDWESGLPISSVTIAASSARRSMNSSPIRFTVLARSSIGTSRHALYAA